MSAESPRECRRVIYHGRVQGVGFRWTVSHIAQRYLVQGFVKNRSDGTVELLAQGTAAEVKAFLDDVAEAMSGNIARADESEESAQADLSGFTVHR